MTRQKRIRARVDPAGGFEHGHLRRPLLVDKLRLLVFPAALGRGKRFFGAGANTAAFKLTKSAVSPSGVLIATDERAGKVATGSFALDE